MRNLIFIFALLFAISCENDPLLSADNVASTDDELLTENQKDVDSIGTDKFTPEKNPCTLIDEVKIKEILSLPKNTPTKISNTYDKYPTCFYEWETILFTKTAMVDNKEVVKNHPAEMSIKLIKNANKELFETTIKEFTNAKAVNNVGEMAVWDDTMNQLTFLSNGYMFHLYLEESEKVDNNKQLAVKIASVIIGDM